VIRAQETAMANVEFTADYAVHKADLPQGTLTQLYLDAVDRFRAAPAFRWFEGERLEEMTHDQAFSLVRAAAGGLVATGLDRGGRVAILSENRPEWAIADYACLCTGIQDIPIYASLTPHQIAYVLSDSGATLVFASSRAQMQKVVEAREECEQEIRIVVFDEVEDPPHDVMSWSALLEKGRALGSEANEEAFRAGARQAKPDEVATILYTSGTTGDPKGVMLTHNNLFSNVTACLRILRVQPDDVTLSFLPLSHVLQRMVDYLLTSSGCVIAYPRSLETVADDLRTVRPTVQVSVPRVYEKVYNKVMEAEGVKGRLVQWAREVGEAWVAETLADREPSGALKLVHRIADALVFKKIRAAVGGRVRWFVSGGGPLSPDINRFFYSAGLTILEGYGLTETSPVTNVNTEENFSIGTVGLPVPGTEVKIAPDGEILVRGPQVMKGYLGRPDATAAAIEDDGWFHTGDIGELEEGFLRITDRKKDILVTAGGKNVAPQPIENLLKKNVFIDQAVMVGDGRRFVSLLVVPAFPNLTSWAQAHGIAPTDAESLCGHPEVQQMMKDVIFGELRDLARFETPKKVALIASEFTIEDGSLTPTQKVKRRVVEDRYAELIEAFYAEENEDRTMFGVS
jgi:long-chain acyl-CoA synthetase